MLKLVIKKSFKKDAKKFSNNDSAKKIIDDFIDLLLECKPLSEKYKNHRLGGKLSDCFEAHATSDLLIIYRKENSRLVLIRVGSHSELF
jgi:mRNA interferase YafQ